MSKLLEVKGLSFGVANKQIVRNVSLKLSNQEIIAVLGKSGSGKSTLLKLIAGLLEPNSGSVLLNGEKVKMPSEQLIAGHPKIKIVRQDNPLFPNISLRENIAYELRYFKKKYRKDRIKYLLKISGLNHVAGQLPREVSEGEQQRAVIARSLADEPDLLLLDEPFSNLDHENKNRLKSEIAAIIKLENMACIFVTHDVSDVFGMASKLAILKDGKIIRSGDPKVLFQKPSSEYEAGLMGKYNLISAEIYRSLTGNEAPQNRTKYLIKPEMISLATEGKLAGTVKSCIFKGIFYELTIGVQEIELLVYTMRSYAVGETTHFDLDSGVWLK